MSHKRKSLGELVVDFEIKKSRAEIVNDNIEKSLQLILARQAEIYKTQSNTKSKIINEIKSIKKIVRTLNRDSLKKDEIIDKLKGELEICRSRISNMEYEHSMRDSHREPCDSFYS
jgi:Txe/YoeB family toxin of Txe-Axe toxin-antitoxin module